MLNWAGQAKLREVMLMPRCVGKPDPEELPGRGTLSAKALKAGGPAGKCEEWLQLEISWFGWRQGGVYMPQGPDSNNPLRLEVVAPLGPKTLHF